MPIQADRIARDLEAFAQIGASGPTAVSRLALTPVEREGRAHFIDLCRAEGMNVRIDRFGNIAAVLGEWDRPALLTGSHLDSVPEGGRFDGVAGVVCALEAVRALKEDGNLPDMPVGVISFTSEESSRWGVATMGSKGLAGVLLPEKLMAMTDRQGVSFAAALQENAGYDLTGGPQDFGPIGGFLELHVEQGLELERDGRRVGVVSRIAAPSRFKVTVEGEAGHSGATLMDRRKDGLTAAAELILGVERLARAEHPATVGTTTVFSVNPVSINVIPGRVELGVDIRSVDADSKRRTVDAFQALIREVSAARGIEITVQTLSEEEPVTLDPAVVGRLEEACRALGVDYMPMWSRAGHDTMYVARIAPAAMLFVPSQGGISHNPAEFTTLEDLVMGTGVLAEAIRRF
jgi:beta-ureidopropionase / N-carbamoyl-L-amino-acid hydrolase